MLTPGQALPYVEYATFTAIPHGGPWDRPPEIVTQTHQSPLTKTTSLHCVRNSCFYDLGRPVCIRRMIRRRVVPISAASHVIESKPGSPLIKPGILSNSGGHT